VRALELLTRRHAALVALEAAAASAAALGLVDRPALRLVPDPDPNGPEGDRVAVVRRDLSPTHNCDNGAPRGEQHRPERCPNPVRLAYHYGTTSELRLLPAACRRKGCPACGAQRVAEHLEPAAAAVATSNVAWRLEVSSTEWTTVRQQLRRAGADYKRMPAAGERFVVWADTAVPGAVRVEAPVDRLRADLEASLTVPGRITSSRAWQRAAAPVEQPTETDERELLGVLVVTVAELRRALRDRGHVNPLGVNTDEHGAAPIHPMDRTYSTVMAREHVERMLEGLIRNPFEGVPDEDTLVRWAAELDRRQLIATAGMPSRAQRLRRLGLSA